MPIQPSVISAEAIARRPIVGVQQVAVGGAIFAADSNGLAFEINIAVASACIYAIGCNYRIAVIGIIYCHLNVVKIRRTVVIDSNYSGLAGNGSAEGGQANKSKNQFTHLNTLLKGFSSGNILSQKWAKGK
ncbi:MAG: hypothetical protein MUO27_02320 [Sedimentisphaerales bacterium]|nr:hypothetical protein [Sedimentisphaerales bacterium]